MLEVGPYFAGENMSFPASMTIDLIATDGVNYGSIVITRLTMLNNKYRGNIAITLNSNVEKINKVIARISMPNYMQYFNTKFDGVIRPFTVELDNLIINLRGNSALREELRHTNTNDRLSLESTLNSVGIFVRTNNNYLTAIGNPSYDLPTETNFRYSWLMDGDYNQQLTNSYGFRYRIHRPVYAYPTDTRVSNYGMRNVEINKYLTTITQKDGETWDDFKERVWSKKYQIGYYKTTNYYGMAINWGDFTENGWMDGQIKLWEVSGHTSIQSLANVIPNLDNPGIKNIFNQVYGPTGRVKGGIPYGEELSLLKYNNYSETVTRNFKWEQKYIPKGSTTESYHSGEKSATILSTSYAINVSEGSIAGQFVDLDTKELLQGIQINLEKEVNNQWVKQDITKTTDNGGLVSFQNLSKGKYKLKVNQFPNGYQQKVNWKTNNNTVINSNGEFSLDTDKSNALITAELEKVKHQTVNFNVRDTANNIVVGEIFQIYKNNIQEPIAQYPTNNQGNFSVNRMPSGSYRLVSTNKQRVGVHSFIVDEGKAVELNVNAIVSVLPHITVSGPSSVNLGNVTIGDSSNSTIPLNTTYKGDSGYIVSVKKSENTNVEIKLNDTVITTQEKELTNLSGTANPVTTMINYQLNAKPTSTATKGSKSTNIIFSFKYKL